MRHNPGHGAEHETRRFLTADRNDAHASCGTRLAATAQEYRSGEASQHHILLAPRVDRVDVRAKLLHWGMPGADVERIMGASEELQAYDGPGGNVRVLSYPTEPIATIVSIHNGQ